MNSVYNLFRFLDNSDCSNRASLAFSLLPALNKFPASKDVWAKGKEYRAAFFLSKNVVFYAHQCSVFKVLIT